MSSRRGTGDWESEGYELSFGSQITCKLCGDKSTGMSQFKNIKTGEYINACAKCVDESESLRSCFYK